MINLETTPKWVIEAKYKSILEIVLAKNSWEDKYPLLESIVDGLLEDKLKECGTM